ncbi:MAG: LamG domain-containing protein [Candidatus Poribacteria bacterium]|nr:LamG domain-containing protein [Candidatus Poribacteria bacterium]
MKQLLKCPTLLVLMLITVGYVKADITDDLVVYFTFDSVKGERILDNSGNGLDAEVIENTKFVKGKYGNAIHITNETEDCVNIPTARALEISEEITMMAWVYHDDWTEGTFQWLDKGSYNRSHSQYGMAVYDEKDLHGADGIGIILGRGEFRAIHLIDNKMKNGTWHHIVGVCTDSSVEIYLDGESVLDFDARKRPRFNGANEQDLRIGCAENKPAYAFKDGFIDEVAIWSRALSETEIRTAMRGPLFPVSPKDKVATTWGNIKGQRF